MSAYDGLRKELERLIGKTVVDSEYTTLIFNDGTVLDMDPYETYITRKGSD